MFFNFSISNNLTILNDGQSYIDYNFNISLTIDNISFQIQRNYLDICDLETHLLKYLSSSSSSSPMIEFPLIGGLLIKRNKNKLNDTFNVLRRVASGSSASTITNTATNITNNDNSELINYISYFNEDRQAYFLSTLESIEDIPSKINDLIKWFQQLFASPRILELYIFAKFFCIEENLFRKNSSEIEMEITEYDYIVPKKNYKTKQILTKFSIPIEVQIGQIIVWRFRSTKFDIAFSIDISGHSILSSKRYASSREEITGVIQVPSIIAGNTWSGTAICEIKFENKFAGV